MVMAARGLQVGVEPLTTDGADEFIAFLGIEEAIVLRTFDVPISLPSQVHLHRLDHQFMKFFGVQV